MYFLTAILFFLTSLSAQIIVPVHAKPTHINTLKHVVVIPTVTPTPTIALTIEPTETLAPTAVPTQAVLPTQAPTVVPVHNATADSATSILLNLLNQSRAQHNAPALRLDGTLSTCALTHSQQMAAKNSLFHDLLNDVCDSSAYKAENIGMDTQQPNDAVAVINTMMMNEGPGGGHYENIINPRYNHVGIGVYYQGSTTWATEDFGGN